MAGNEIIRLTVGASPRFAALTGLMHLAAGGAVWASGIGLAASVSLSLVIAAAAYHSLSREALRRNASSIVAIILHPDCRCAFTTRDGTEAEAELLDSSFVSPALTVVNLHPHGRRLARHVIIFPDAVEPTAYRKLRVRLKWGCPPPEPG